MGDLDAARGDFQAAVKLSAKEALQERAAPLPETSYALIAFCEPTLIWICFGFASSSFGISISSTPFT